MDTLYRLSSRCFDPVCYLRKGAALFKVYPLVEDLPYNRQLAQAYVVAKMAIAILLVPIATPFGFLLRAMGSLLDSEQFLYARLPDSEAQEGLEARAPEARRRVSILSWNLCGVGAGYSITDGGPLPIEMRINQVAQCILHSNPDLFFGQEVMDIQNAAQLRQRLHRDGGFTHFYYHMNGGSPLMGPSSGLFVASKIELTDPQFTPFTFTNEPKNHRFSHKGVFSCRLALQGGAITCMNTHFSYSLHVGDPTNADRTRRLQQLATCSDQALRFGNQAPALLIGDLNLAHQEWVMPISQKGVEWHDAASEPPPATWAGDQASVEFCQASRLFRDPEKQATTVGQPLDRALYANLPAGWRVMSQVPSDGTGFDPMRFRCAALSDHQPLSAILTLPETATHHS